MEGRTVVTSDDHKLGTVVSEAGRLRGRRVRSHVQDSRTRSRRTSSTEHEDVDPRDGRQGRRSPTRRRSSGDDLRRRRGQDALRLDRGATSVDPIRTFAEPASRRPRGAGGARRGGHGELRWPPRARTTAERPVDEAAASARQNVSSRKPPRAISSTSASRWCARRRRRAAPGPSGSRSRTRARRALERLREAHHATLAADAADLDRLADDRHVDRLASGRESRRSVLRRVGRELQVGFAARRVDARSSTRPPPSRRRRGPDALDQLARRARTAGNELRRRDACRSRARAEARRRPAVLHVVGARRARRRGRPPSSAVAHSACSERGERGREANVRRLVGHAHLERAELRMRAHVPPDARVVLDHAETPRALDPRLPLARTSRTPAARRRAAARRARARGSTPCP